MTSSRGHIHPALSKLGLTHEFLTSLPEKDFSERSPLGISRVNELLSRGDMLFFRVMSWFDFSDKY